MRNLKFGIELEVSTRWSKQEIVNALIEAGIDAVGDVYGSQVNHKQWKVQYDGSLNNGWELVSPPMVDTEELEKVMYVLRKVIKAQGTPKTGLHIHHDINDFTIDQVKNLYSLYNKYEKNALRSIMRKQRFNNAYCRPVSFVSEIISNLENMSDFSGAIRNRYYTLNSGSYVKYGTIEFRHHHGTTDVNEVMTWLNITHKFVEAAQNGVDGNSPLKAETYEEALEEMFEEIGLDNEQIKKLARRRRKAIAKADDRRERIA